MKMKRTGILLCLLALALLAACGASAEEPKQPETEGRLLLAANGTALLVTEDGEPIVLSVEAEGDGPWDGFHSGDKIAAVLGDIRETWPAQAGVSQWRLLEAGTMEDLPEETLTDLEALGWDLGRETHAPAAEPQTVEDPTSGYCGNTVTTVKLGEEEYSFWGGDSVRLTDILINLAYDPGKVCRCLPEFTVDTEFGAGYGVNLTEFYARCEAGQAPLTEEQAETIRDILVKNCK